MNELNRNTLRNIHGGAINATMLNALARGTELIYNIGSQFGSALRYLIKGKACR